ncbi:16S rRNA (adenine1518-N6/adenine1519-N6)-dimethyltransferase [Polaromonas sp. CG_9.5]|uniref:16S rRNA (adenine(1518)-N(6)/adenine(1519)-N(6))- dimethyltransferase RsmA n=1 Tax=Polaromonas sp. CG_9.5 TaxID=3071705 RepID=UPI002E025CD2|nr:16S rRNA (adenine1518-N6/adenine1519-N6)-dimethyltransferase [Polaromonas sp. CG_9.5]
MKHIARKRFGQHFLTDRLIIQGIVDAIAPLPGQPMVEIGPGLAAMTRPLVERLGHLTVIELDRDLASQLRSNPKLTVIESDVLRVDFRQLAEEVQLRAPKLESAAAPSGGSAPHEAESVGVPKLRVVGNLPYNISTPILFHLLDAVDAIEDQHFMLQKEVIDRMVAAPSTSDYGRLSVMLQWRYAMENVLYVPPQSFDPPPRVDSAIVRMVPHAAPAVLDVKLLSELVRVAFSQRRKLLRHTLGKWLEQKEFSGDFDVKRRAEEVPVAEYLALTQQVMAGTPAPEKANAL